MDKEIVLVEPGNKWATEFSVGGIRADPITLGYLSSSLRQDGHNVTIVQQRGGIDKELIDYIASQNPDIVGISTMTYNFNKGRAVARGLKERIPHIQTVFGGYHVSANPEVLSFPEIDYLVIGEGEATLRELVDCILYKKTDLENIKGIGYKKENRVILNPRRERIANLDSLPFPERYGLEDCLWGSPILPIPANQKSFAQVTYSRGCYHHCSFCTSSELWQGQVVHRSASNMVDEIEYLIDKFGTNGLFFTDLTFNADKQKAMEFCDEMIRRKVKINWMTACRVTSDIELLKRMREGGCIKIAYGVETLEDERLAELSKGVSSKEIVECFRNTNDLGIITRAYIMVGYPDESEESIRKTKQNVKRLPTDQLRISIITPFPGTPFQLEMKKKRLIISDNTDDYDTVTTPIIRTKITSEGLLGAVNEIQREFYSDPNYRKRIEAKAKRFPELKSAYDDFFCRLKEQEFI